MSQGMLACERRICRRRTVEGGCWKTKLRVESAVTTETYPLVHSRKEMTIVGAGVDGCELAVLMLRANISPNPIQENVKTYPLPASYSLTRATRPPISLTSVFFSRRDSKTWLSVGKVEMVNVQA